MRVTRRRFTTFLAASTTLAASSLRGSAFVKGQIRLGLNTYSLRALPHDAAIATIVRVMREQRLQDCQLLFTHVEPAQFGPVFSVAGPNNPAALPAPPTPEQMEERKAAAAARSEWRLSVPMSYFESIRSSFQREGLQIRAYATMFSNSEEEVDRLFLMAKTLGAESINGRVSDSLTDLVAAAAGKYRLRVGIQVADVKLLANQLRTSPYLRADPDAGDLTKEKVDALQFLQEYASHIDSIDLKDAIAGVGSVAFGKGDANLAGIVRHLSEEQLPITAYIDCDYPGTGQSVEEVARCLSFVRSAVTGA